MPHFKIEPVMSSGILNHLSIRSHDNREKAIFKYTEAHTLVRFTEKYDL